MPSAEDCFRLKLEFDNPPPGMPASSRYMILVKPGSCKTIYDLEQQIIRKFGFYKGATTLLAVDGFTLVSTEDVHILSNNDCVSVTILQTAQKKSSKKRKLDDKCVETTVAKVAKINDVCCETKTKAKGSKVTRISDARCGQKNTSKVSKSTSQIAIKPKIALVKVRKLKPSTSTDDSSDSSSSEKVSGNRKLRKMVRVNGSGVEKIKVIVGKEVSKTPKTASSPVPVPGKEKEKRSSSEDSSDSNDSEEVSCNTILTKTVKVNGSGDKNSAKVGKEYKTTIQTSLPVLSSEEGKKSQPASSPNIHNSSATKLSQKSLKATSKESLSHSANLPNQSPIVPAAVCIDSKAVKEPNATRKDAEKTLNTKRPIKSIKGQNIHHVTFDSSDSGSTSSESEMETDIEKQPQVETKSLNRWLQSADYSPKTAVPASHQLKTTKDPGVSTNISTVIQNPSITPNTSKRTNNQEKAPTRPDRNFSALLPSTWPPRVGDTIAYKMLEMSQDYTPIITDFKEAKVVEIFLAPSSPIGVNAVRVKQLWPLEGSSKREGGRFEMDLSDDETSDNNNEHILEWQSLLDPKRIE